mmetsp:Transcript_50365/g.129732  ORF Transcript_50365/g.129732 Transcript_50365/m.129732 type:complete len:178 (-) Transcript_50365:2373-2906(-)
MGKANKKKKSWRKIDVERTAGGGGGVDADGDMMMGGGDEWATGPVDENLGMNEEFFADTAPKKVDLPPSVPPTADVEKARAEEDVVLQSHPNAKVKQQRVKANKYTKADDPYLWKSKKIEKNAQKKGTQKAQKLSSRQRMKKQRAAERGVNAQLRLIKKSETIDNKSSVKSAAKEIW